MLACGGSQARDGGSRAAGGFGLVFPEQIAIQPDGRTSTSCAGLWDDAQIEGLARINRLVKDMGAVPAWGGVETEALITA